MEMGFDPVGIGIPCFADCTDNGSLADPPSVLYTNFRKMPVDGLIAVPVHDRNIVTHSLRDVSDLNPAGAGRKNRCL